ncbi:sensor histidine kinase [Leadbettera azotonutricia]|uniref:histidine kinase n=1 Tax=Leadbettera azotonutricia (strain ATCC BAA-888 / DSM 13862 / ZAS-9) TaxID=545695 RepID=F5YCV2_LEAAZ|nr:ATP-binding protein [Leadbettera azotonutricia]AEF83043.1 sensor histidine kinase, response regulator [Leadbettera azotonutricia ZAS-9]
MPSEFDSYFRLLWLLVLFIGLLMACLSYIYLAMRKARKRELQNMAFSSLALEAQETERRRIAAELHDTVLPDLRDNPAAARIREICGRLMPPDLIRFSLKDSLSSLCDSFVKRTGIECIVEIEESLDFNGLSDEHRLHLYRIAQEALNNIGKHSHAKQAVLVARQGVPEPVGFLKSKGFPGKGQPLLFSISDDGQGLQSRPGLRREGKHDGLGMSTMRQRAAILGAHIDFISVEGNGLMVCVKVPPQDKP